MSNRPLRVFLCHGTNDKDATRSLFNQLNANGMDTWLDEVRLLPGQDSKSEIQKAIKRSDAVVVVLSRRTITKEGGVQREIKQALDMAEEKRDHAIYLIPAKVERCKIPDGLSSKRGVNLYEKNGYEELLNALCSRAKELRRKLPIEVAAPSGEVNLGVLPPLSLRPPIPFVNRVDEIDAITATASAGGQYFLIDAPAGYGKTYLLSQLNERFAAKEKWDHAFVSVKKDCNLETLTFKLAEALGVKLNSDTNLDWGYRFSGAIKKKYQNSRIPVGLALFIDLDGESSPSLLGQLLEKFILQVWESLAELDAFSSAKPQSQFRVIVSGRNVAANEDLKTFYSYLPLINRSLAPFTYDVVCQSVGNYLQGFEKSRVNQLAAHIMFMTGGHPGCMTQVLHFYSLQQAPIDKLITDFGEIIWEEIVRDVSDKVWRGLPGKGRDFHSAIDRLSIFRYVNNYILKYVLDACPVPDLRDEIDFRALLTTNYLYTGDGRFLQDDMNRRLMIIRLRHTAPREYKEYCEDAYKICIQQLQEPTVQLPEKWVVEFLNQFLQQFAGARLDQPSVRVKISEQFYEELARVLKIRREYKKSLPDWREEMEALLVEMEKKDQWEFRFSVNYFLRENQYDDKPYQKLKSEIRSLSRSR